MGSQKFGQCFETLPTIEYVKMIATFYAPSEWASEGEATTTEALLANEGERRITRLTRRASDHAPTLP